VRIIFAGGGTGGHLYPAIAIADALSKRDGVAFIGTANRLESGIVPKAGYPLYTVPSRPLTRKLSFELLRAIFTNARGVISAARILSKIAPDIVIATGGYVCAPVALAARMLRLRPIVLLEPNARPGLTSRVLAPLVDEVWGAFPEGDARFAGKYRYTGIPVRSSLRSLPPRDEAIARLGIAPQRRTLLAMGGSQGARSINDALIGLLRSGGLPSGWQLVHLTGQKEYDRVREAVDGACDIVKPYLDDLSDAYAAADLILSRAGASTVGELAAIGKPAILVPYPHAADDHQRANAYSVAATGAAIVVDDRDLLAGRLRGILDQVTQPVRFAALAEAAARARVRDPVASILARIDALVGRRTNSS
jgi:UDP-N-acetylglucosamine--N-acetylmuramyl-(pentapeptide) pyrophosphoryl-undecaprenol N-acetylglucosamine transferase